MAMTGDSTVIFLEAFAGAEFKSHTRRAQVKYLEYTFGWTLSPSCYVKVRPLFYIMTQQCFKQVPTRMGENCKNYISKYNNLIFRFKFSQTSLSTFTEKQ